MRNLHFTTSPGHSDTRDRAPCEAQNYNVQQRVQRWRGKPNDKRAHSRTWTRVIRAGAPRPPFLAAAEILQIGRFEADAPRALAACRGGDTARANGAPRNAARPRVLSVWRPLSAAPVSVSVMPHCAQRSDVHGRDLAVLVSVARPSHTAGCVLRCAIFGAYNIHANKRPC